MDPPPQLMRHRPLMIRPPPPPPPSSSSSDTNFPILAISILGILTTAILLLSYYVFVIKCCLNWRRSDVLRRLSRSPRVHRGNNTVPFHSAGVSEGRGLEESAIQAIPTFRFRSTGGGQWGKRPSFHECAVCLNEFQEEERIRLLPNCLHVFHIDCIDTWLQTSANCPLCRSDITAAGLIEAGRLMVGSCPQTGDVVMEVRDDGGGEGQQQAPTRNAEEQTEEKQRRKRRRHRLCSMGDECIDVRRGGEDGELCVQPIRRSFSMDSSSNQQLYLAVQEILQRNPHFKGVASGEGSSGGGRARRHFFSFGNYRSSRSSVLPVQIEV